jgi:integrase
LIALPDPFKTMVFVAAGTGLRRGELIGLKWEDIDFDAALIQPKRSIVNQHIGNLKTLASAKPVTLDPYLGAALASWQAQSPFRGEGDWVLQAPRLPVRNRTGQI